MPLPVVARVIRDQEASEGRSQQSGANQRSMPSRPDKPNSKAFHIQTINYTQRQNVPGLSIIPTEFVPRLICVDTRECLGLATDGMGLDKPYVISVDPQCGAFRQQRM